MAVAIVHPPRWRWGTRDSYAGVGPSASTFSLPASLCLHRASRATEVANQEDPTGPRPRGVGSTDQEGGRLANLPPARRAGLRALLAGVDLPVAEVAHEEVAAKPADARRRERQPPRPVHLNTAGGRPEGGAAGLDR